VADSTLYVDARGAFNRRPSTMSLTFWIKRFCLVFCGAFVVLLAVNLLKGKGARASVIESVIWAGIATTVFIATRLYYSRKGKHCALCRDTPEMAGEGASCPPKSDHRG
jgi:hypothetical protein